jgi:DNA helicase IV
MSPELWVVIGTQASGIAVSVGIYLKTMAIIEKKIDSLENDKLDKSVHEATVERLDQSDRALTHRVNGVEQIVVGREYKRGSRGAQA